MLIIDDLGRCDPTQIDKVMSTLSFLFRGARCHAVLNGLEHVRTAVGWPTKTWPRPWATTHRPPLTRLGRPVLARTFWARSLQLRMTLPVQPAAPVVLRGQAPALDTRVWQPAITLASTVAMAEGLLTQAWLNRCAKGWLSHANPCITRWQWRWWRWRWAVHALTRR